VGIEPTTEGLLGGRKRRNGPWCRIHPIVRSLSGGVGFIRLVVDWSVGFPWDFLMGNRAEVHVGGRREPSALRSARRKLLRRDCLNFIEEVSVPDVGGWPSGESQNPIRRSMSPSAPAPTAVLSADARIGQCVEEPERSRSPDQAAMTCFAPPCVVGSSWTWNGVICLSRR